MSFGKRPAAHPALEGFDDPWLEPIREAARAAQLANRKTFIARLPTPPGDPAAGDVRLWSAAVQQIGMHGWTLTGWAVVVETEGPVAYPAFTRS